MSKLDKIVLLINLLHHRRSITSETIQNICNISERSVYRYINSISKANIPVHYDKTVGGYCLDRRDSFGIDDLIVSDAVLLSVALHVLSQKLDDSYTESIEQLRRRIFTRLALPFEELWDSFAVRTEQGLESESISELVTSFLIHTSVMNNKELRLVLSDESPESRVIDVKNPVLRFQGEWCIESSRNSDQGAIPISRIRKAMIL
jgi:hypothetical protein